MKVKAPSDQRTNQSQRLRLRPVEHEVLRAIRREVRSGIRGKDDEGRTAFLAVAVSGGVDSMTLAHVVARLRPVLEKPLLEKSVLGKPLSVKPIYVLHVHHGLTGNQKQDAYRNRAQAAVKAVAKGLGVRFLTNRPWGGTKPSENAKQSEAALRELRYGHFEKWLRHLEKKHGGPGLILLAHHWQDQLETRLQRLIRGAGIHGAKGMAARRKATHKATRSAKTSSAVYLRPLLGVKKEAIEALAKELEVPWVKDPSNRSIDPFRNWLRERWLPELERKAPGGVRRLALSLERSLEQSPEPGAEHLAGAPTQYDRARYFALSTAAQRRWIVTTLRGLGCRNYTVNHVQEIQKRLDTRRKVFTFTVLASHWTINAQQIAVWFGGSSGTLSR
jgi:tRNA(Ile)-lysidine synthase